MNFLVQRSISRCQFAAVFLTCCTCQAFSNTIFGAGRGVGILWYKLFVTSGAHHFFNAVIWQPVVKDTGARSSQPECKSFLLCFFSKKPTNCVLSDFPLAFVVYLSWFRKILVLLGFIAQRVQSCQDSLPFSGVPPAISPA